MANDKPRNVISVSDLEDIEANPDPVRVPLKGGKFVTFPDVYDMPLEDAEEFFDELARGQAENNLSRPLKRWLSEKDYAALLAQYGTIRKLQPVVERVMAAYEKSWGTVGEGNDSES